MKSKRLYCIAIALLVISGCSKREQLAVRLAEERRAAEAKAPASPEEFLQAAMRGDANAVRVALDRGVDVNVLDEDGRSALQLAAFDGHQEVVELLLEHGAQVDYADAMGRTALMFASTGPHVETVERLIEAGANINAVDGDEHFTALMFAAAEGQKPVVESLLRAGANPDLRDVDNDSALDFASQNGHAEIVSLLQGVVAQDSPAP
ncbi:MAG: ankyrin repeat domain-containing protein [Planctomycetaceae bacterium]